MGEETPLAVERQESLCRMCLGVVNAKSTCDYLIVLDPRFEPPIVPARRAYVTMKLVEIDKIKHGSFGLIWRLLHYQVQVLCVGDKTQGDGYLPLCVQHLRRARLFRYHVFATASSGTASFLESLEP